MKKFKIIIYLFIASFTTAYSQNHITLDITNKTMSNSNATWTFDLVATALPTYTGMNNNWAGMTIRFDVANGGTILVTSGTASMNPTYAFSGGVQPSVPGAPPAGSVEFGFTAARNGQTDLIVGTPVTIGTYTINFAMPVDPTSVVTPRASTATSGSFWSNFNGGTSLPFTHPAPFPLPVKLKTFEVIKDGDRASRLDWISATEINSDYFGIERSQDGQNWETIGQVQAAGNSHTDIAYQYFDRKLPKFRTGVNIFYYRLKMVDQDGKFKYSDVRGVNFGKTADGIVSIYPNPTTDMINVDLSGMILEDGDVSLTVFDMNGRALISKNILGNGIELIEVDQIPSGTYNVVVQQGDTIHHKKIIKID